MSRPQILVDLDGPLGQLLPRWLELINADHGCHLKTADIDHWAFHDLTPASCGIKTYEYLWRPDLYDGVRPTPGSGWGIRELSKLGDVTVVTSTNSLQASLKMRWLSRWGFMPHLRQVVTLVSGGDGTKTPDKGLVHGDVLVDDYVGNLEAFKGTPILFKNESPYTHGHAGWLTADSWAGVVNLVSELLVGRPLAPVV